jgi:hypothetical protein
VLTKLLHFSRALRAKVQTAQECRVERKQAHEEQQRKMLAMAGGLHARLGAGSFVLRLDDNLLKMIWEEVERWCAVPAAEAPGALQ